MSFFVEDTGLILRNDLAGSTSGFFNRPWTAYEQGFGRPTAVYYWIGLDRLHEMSQGNCQARLQNKADGTWHHANYSSFSVGNSSTNYTLTIGGYSGETGFDGMALSNAQPFSTDDADHDTYTGFNCASELGGGFWYGHCGQALITTSIASNYFMWYTPAGWMYLNAVEVFVLCQWVASDDDYHQMTRATIGSHEWTTVI